MAYNKRKVQTYAKPHHQVGTGQNAIVNTTRLAAMILMMELALNNARRANLEKVRLDRMDYRDVEFLISILKQLLTMEA